MYKYETHLHTYPVSRCASSDVIEVLKLYKELGYDGVFITNHFIDGNFNMDADASYEDKISYRKFEDGVIRYDGGPASDLHASSNDMKAYLAYFNMFTDQNDIRCDDFALIPYRSFQAVKTKNLLVAGRCLSADRIVHARVRVMGYCMEMGQVTGTAAAMLKDRNGITDDIDIKDLQDKLRLRGLLNV